VFFLLFKSCHIQEILRAKRRAQDDVPGELRLFYDAYKIIQWDEVSYEEISQNILKRNLINIGIIEKLLYLLKLLPKGLTCNPMWIPTNI
jgi:hypothetical protein